jgi:hypothetical protein
MTRITPLMSHPERIICPKCELPRPRNVEEARGVDGEFTYPCCNQDCGGEWGTGCYHCHHPKFWNPQKKKEGAALLAKANLCVLRASESLADLERCRIGVPQELRELADRCLTHVRCAQAPLRVELTDREPGGDRRKISAALLSLSDAEDRLIRAASGRESEWTLLLAEALSLCARAREWITEVRLLEGASIRTNLDAVLELLRLYRGADQFTISSLIDT